MVARDNRITIHLPVKLLKYVNDEAERRGLDPRKRGNILLEALSEKYERSKKQQFLLSDVAENPQTDIDIDTLSDRVAKEALRKIEKIIGKNAP